MHGPWSRGEKLAVLSLTVSVFIAIIGFFANEVRRKIGLETLQTDTGSATSVSFSAVNPVHSTTTQATERQREDAPKARSAVVPAPAAPSPRRASDFPRHEITRHGTASDSPEVVAAAAAVLDALGSSSYAVRGYLRAEQSTPDDALQGLITTHFVLDVRLVDKDGRTNGSFTVTSRGGGFSAEASALHARTRLMDELRRRIGKEQS